MDKKVLIIIGVIIIIGVSFFSGRVSRDKGFGELENTANELESQLEEQTGRIESLRDELIIADSRIKNLVGRIRDLETTNQYITKQLGNIGAGVSKDIGKIQGLIKAIDSYLKETDE